MSKYINVNVNLDELEKDYWEWILREYIKTRESKKSYIESPNKNNFIKVERNKKYFTEKTKEIWSAKIWYIPSILEIIDKENRFSIYRLQENIWFSDATRKNLVKDFIKHWVIVKKRLDDYYLNPLFWYFGKTISIELWEMFKEELESVWIQIK